MGKAPADAQWLELTRRDPEAGTVERMGECARSFIAPFRRVGQQPHFL